MKPVRPSLIFSFLALFIPGCENACVGDCKVCPCPPGSACVNEYLVSLDKYANLCRVLPGHPLLTVDPAPICDGGAD
jgi:hypothetical protein